MIIIHKDENKEKTHDYLVDVELKKEMTCLYLLTIAIKKKKGTFKPYIDLANRISDKNFKEIL